MTERASGRASDALYVLCTGARCTELITHTTLLRDGLAIGKASPARAFVL